MACDQPVGLFAPDDEADDDAELVRCEGCEALLDAERCYRDVEGCALCDECRNAAPKVRWNGEEWVPVEQPPTQYGSLAKCALADCEDPVIVKTVYKGADVFLCERHGLEVADD